MQWAVHGERTIYASPWVSRSARLALSELTAVYPPDWSGAVAVEGRG